MAYSGGFKSRMIQRLTGPQAVSAKSLSREVGVPASTLNYWLREARTLVDMAGHTDSSPQSWTAEEKYKVVIEAAAVPEAELGEFLRKKGLHAAQLDEWRRLMKAALTTGGKTRTPSDTADKKRLRELERELRHKDKALAEAAALLVLKKNWRCSGGTRTRTLPRGKRRDPRTPRRGCRVGRQAGESLQAGRDQQSCCAALEARRDRRGPSSRPEDGPEEQAPRARAHGDPRDRELA